MKHFYIICFLLSSTILLKAQPSEYISLCNLQSEIKSYIFNNPNHDSAFKLIERGISIAAERQDSSSLASMYCHKAGLYMNTDPKMALQYFYKAKEIFQALNNERSLASTYRALGVIDHLSSKQKFHFLMQSISISKRIGDDYILAEAYNNLGTYYDEVGKLDSSLYYLNKSIQLREEKGLTSPMGLSAIAGAYNNIGVIYKKMDQYDTALKYFHKGKNILPRHVNEDFYINILSNLGLTYLKINKEDSAFYYFEQVEDQFYRRPDLTYSLYYYLSEFYKKQGEYKTALIYYEKSDSIREILQQNDKSDALNLLELEYDAKVKKEQLAALSAEISESRTIRISLAVGLFLTALFSVLLFYQQKQKSRKKRALLEAEQKLLSTELQNSAIKQKYLNDELRYINRELTSYATGIAHNQNFLNDLRKQIVDISHERNVYRMRNRLHDMNVMLLQVFKDSNKNEEFMEKSFEINNSMIFYLRTHFEQLNESDISLLIMTFLKFDTKEIAVLQNIEPKSVRMKRYRLRKKLDLDGDDSFEEFFSKIVEETKMKHTG